MISNKCFIYFAVLIALVTQIHTACVCNEKGSDYCAGCTGRLVVKPKPKYPVKPDIDLSPVGDSCWCSKMMIQPASLPKPCSKNKPNPPPPPPPPSCGCKTPKPYSSYDHLPSIYNSPPSSSYVMPQPTYVPTIPKDYSLPADPVSVSLAVQSGKAIEVPEAKLAYGFVQKPIDGLPKVFISSVNEEKLYALKSDVITLKKPVRPQKPAEDYPEVEEEEAHGADIEDEYLPSLTYKQLGYVPEQFKNPQFQDVGSSYAYASSAGYSQPYVVQDKVPADCGYKPGRIAKYKGTKTYAELYK